MRPALRKTLLWLRLALVCVALVFVQAPAQASPLLDTVVLVAAGDDPDAQAAPLLRTSRPSGGGAPAIAAGNDAPSPSCAQPRASPKLYLRFRALLR